jgi:hypothetical protein
MESLLLTKLVLTRLKARARRLLQSAVGVRVRGSFVRRGRRAHQVCELAEGLRLLPLARRVVLGCLVDVL